MYSFSCWFLNVQVSYDILEMMKILLSKMLGILQVSFVIIKGLQILWEIEQFRAKELCARQSVSMCRRTKLWISCRNLDRLIHIQFKYIKINCMIVVTKKYELKQKVRYIFPINFRRKKHQVHACSKTIINYDLQGSIKLILVYWKWCWSNLTLYSFTIKYKGKNDFFITLWKDGELPILVTPKKQWTMSKLYV